MRIFDRLSRGIRVFRVSADLRGVQTELHDIRLALQCICREAFGVELAPESPSASPSGAEHPYFTDGGAPETDRVRQLLFDAGYRPDPAGQDPIFAAEEATNDPNRDRIAASGRNPAHAGPPADLAWPDPDRDPDPYD